MLPAFGGERPQSKGMDEMRKCKLCGEDRQNQFYGKNKTRCKECVKAKQYEFNAENPEYLKAKNHRRRARQLALPNTLNGHDWKAVLEGFGGACAISEIESKDIVLEHVIPLAWGHMGTEKGNVIPMDKTLNLSKRDKNFFTWVLEDNIVDAVDFDKIDRMIEYLAEANGMSVEEYIEYVIWCEYNKRTVEEIEAATKSSIELFREDV